MSRENAERPTVEGAGPENFIPWSQIEPLVRPGMTFQEMGHALLTRLGLSSERYKIVGSHGGPVALSLRPGGGVHVITLEERNRMLMSGKMHLAGHEVIA